MHDQQSIPFVVRIASGPEILVRIEGHLLVEARLGFAAQRAAEPPSLQAWYPSDGRSSG